MPILGLHLSGMRVQWDIPPLSENYKELRYINCDIGKGRTETNYSLYYELLWLVPMIVIL